GDIEGALAAYRAAVQVDPADAEAAIYAADLAIAQDRSPFVTLVAAVAFGSDDAAARAELQGVFLAQQQVNQCTGQGDQCSLNPLPPGVRVRVLVLNTGSDAAGAKDASNFLLDQIRAGNAQHLVGIIGDWPSTAQTRSALGELLPSGFAVLDPVAGADGLGRHAARCVPPGQADSRQGSELAASAVNDLKAQHLLVLRDGDQDTQSKYTADAFLASARGFAGRGVTVSSAAYTSGEASSFRALADRAS